MSPPTSVADVLGRTTERLAAAGVETPGVDAEILVGHVLGITRSALAAAHARELEPEEDGELVVLVGRRADREPLQYILGEWGFRRLTLGLDPRALIPRPETETVVERVLAILAGSVAPAVLDVGTGSGAIALAIADERPDARVAAIDISADALALARENAQRNGLTVAFDRHDLHRGLPAGPWDAVVSNPPYVAVSDRATLAPEVRDWEPAGALFDRGEAAAIARGALDVLADGGALVLEVGDGQAATVAALLTGLGYSDVGVTLDLAGRERVVEGRR